MNLITADMPATDVQICALVLLLISAEQKPLVNNPIRKSIGLFSPRLESVSPCVSVLSMWSTPLHYVVVSVKCVCCCHLHSVYVFGKCLSLCI